MFVLLLPFPTEMYPPGDSTRVTVKDLSHILEGEVRPHFFEGVASVVSRLFLHVSPDVAVFGEKDYQQLLVIKRMTQDLGFGIEVIGAPTRREADGLAMSSRNAYLNADERAQAAALSGVMFATAAKLEAAIRSVHRPMQRRLNCSRRDLLRSITSRRAAPIRLRRSARRPALQVRAGVCCLRRGWARRG